MVAEATAPRRENVPRHILFSKGKKRFLTERAFGRNQYGLEKYREFSA